MTNSIISPTKVDNFVSKILSKINNEFEPEIIPVIIEPYSKMRNCYINVDEKVSRDGGNVHYGWAIFKSDILCEAERHAVWENDDGELIDITPRECTLDQLMFVSDNNFVYEGQLVDNLRINITTNPIIDDFIFVCENLEKLYTFGSRIDDERMSLPQPVSELITQYDNLKMFLLAFINSGGTIKSKCFCGGQKNYKNCHMPTLRQNILNDVKSIKNQLK